MVQVRAEWYKCEQGGTGESRVVQGRYEGLKCEQSASRKSMEADERTAEHHTYAICSSDN